MVQKSLRFPVDSIVGNMRIVKQNIGYFTKAGKLIPSYEAECQECGRVKTVTHGAMQKRIKEGRKKCYSCAQEKGERGRSKKTKPYVGYELNVPYELFKQFISQR
jgi:hypothetical protein